MGTLCSEKMYREEMVKELVKGKNFANQLQGVLQKPFEEDGLVSAEDLVVKILGSFTQALSALSSNSSSSSCDDRNNLQQQENSCNVNSDGHRRSEDSGESKKRPALKDKRGCYKRKKNSQTWTIVSSAIEDGNAWRKYGQKVILNAKYSRSYYRCTHKYAQDCMATKQVQKMDDDPQKYEITYIGIHTCSDLISFPQIVTQNSDPNWSRSTSASGGGGGSYVASSSSSVPTEVKQEYKEETTSTDHNLSSLDSIMWEDFVPFQSSDHEPDQAVAAMVFSCNKMIYSHHGLDMYTDIEPEFQFDELF